MWVQFSVLLNQSYLDKNLVYSYAHFLCMKEFSMSVNLALLLMQVVKNGSFPSRKQKAPQRHKWKLRRKKKLWENKTDFGRKLVIQRQAEATGKQKDAWACCLTPGHGEAPNLCFTTAPELRIRKSSFQMPVATSCISQLHPIQPLSHISFVCNLRLPVGL